MSKFKLMTAKEANRNSTILSNSLLDQDVADAIRLLNEQIMEQCQDGKFHLFHPFHGMKPAVEMIVRKKLLTLGYTIREAEDGQHCEILDYGTPCKLKWK